MPINFGQAPDSNTDSTDNQATPAAATPGVSTAPVQPTPAPINPNQVLRSAAQAQQQSKPQPPTPQQLHTSIFTNILGTLAGGSNRPMLGPNGQPQTDANGNVIMAPASRKALGASILAGALSSMVAGYAAPTSRTDLGGGRSVQDFGPSAAAGAAASQPYTQAGAQAKAQGQADANTGRMYATVDHNLKLHAAQLNNLKLQGDLLQQGVQQDAPIIEGLAQAQPITDPNDPSKTIDPIQAQNVTETQLQKMMADGSTHVTRDSVLRDGVANVYDDDGKQVFNSDGTPRQENTFTVYNHNALVGMTDEMKGLSPNLKDVAAGTPVPVAVLAKYSRDKAVQAAATAGIQNQLKMYDETNGTKTTFSLQSALNQSPIIKTILPQIGKYGSDPIDLMFKDLRNDKTVSPTALGALQNAMGVTAEGLQKMATQRADVVLQQKDKEAEAKAIAEANAKRLTPEGQADLLHKQLENNSLIQAAAQAKAQGQGIQVPNNFTANPKANEMDAGALQSDLSAKGVNIPSNFSALYAIAHNAADLATLPTTPRKGVNVMPRDQALSYIRTYINPQYQEGDYSAAKKLSGELASTRVGTAGGTLLSAGTAANHLNLLEQAGQALNNNDVQAINKLANSFGIAVGKSPAVTFQAIAEQVNSEVAKVVAGGNPNEPELQANRKTLNSDQSPQQVRNVIRSYVGLMNGRIGEIDDRSMQYFGRHVKGVSPTAAQVFNKYGFAAPGQVVVVDPTGKQRFFNDAASADNFKKLAGIQ